MRKVKIGILGAGTVGAGVYELLKKNRDLIARKSGIDVEVKMVADKDINRKELLNIPSTVFTESADDVISDPDIEIVVELIGGIQDYFSAVNIGFNGAHRIIDY